ncbi:MAG: Rieske (2Fe-2S) protein [Nitrososphaerales archaeon]
MIEVANVEGVYYAIGNICTHAGAELHEGELEGKENVEIISFYSRIYIINKLLIFDIS